MNIVHYYPRALIGDGGASLSMRGWARGLAHEGQQVTVAYDEFRPDAIEEGLLWVHLPHRHVRSGKIPNGLQDVLVDADLLVLQSGWVTHNLLAANAANKAEVPYVITPQGAYHPSVLSRRRRVKRVWLAALERRLLNGSLAIHMHFDGEKEHLSRIGYRGNVIVAPNGIERGRGGSQVPEDFRWDGGSGGYVLWMGRYDIEHKGLDLLLKGLAAIPEKERPILRMHGPDFRGGKAQTEHLVEELGLRDQVRVDPPIYGDEKWAVMQQSLLFVYPSRWDSNSVATMEAAGLGIPVLATSTTYVGPRLAADGGALVVDPTPDAMAQGLIAGTSPRAAAIGEQAENLIREQFSWTNVVRQFLHQLRPLM
jgi:glycosyltransferase involved in cell wall biosynthesis